MDCAPQVEPKERPEAALIRELQEELGIEVRLLSLALLICLLVGIKEMSALLYASALLHRTAALRGVLLYSDHGACAGGRGRSPTLVFCLASL